MHLDPKVFGPCLALGISTFVMLSTESLLSISLQAAFPDLAATWQLEQ